MVLLGNEIVILSIEDARKLTSALLRPGCDVRGLQRLDVVEILVALRDAVRRYDYDDEEN